MFWHLIWILNSQCFLKEQFGNDRFYEKSILKYLEVLKWLFLHIWKLWILIFINFCCTLWGLKSTKSTKFRVLKMAKTAVLKPVDSPKLISRKILKLSHSEKDTSKSLTICITHQIFFSKIVFLKSSRNKKQSRLVIDDVKEFYHKIVFFFTK